jgi:uncharacterized protein (TIRG00374 family)
VTQDSTQGFIGKLAVPRASYFVTTGNAPRVRRPRDVAAAVLGVMLLVWALFNLDRVPAWEQAFVELVQSSPGWVTALFGIAYISSLVYFVVVLISLFFGGNERRSALRDVLIASGAAVVLVVIISFLVNGEWPYVLPEIDLENPTPRFPVMRVAMVTAALGVVAPHLARPLRLVGWLAVLVTGLASVGLSYGSPMHIIGSFGIGLICAGGWLTAAGSPSGIPAAGVVAASLGVLGTSVRSLGLGSHQTWGVARFSGVDETGQALDVKVYGRDAVDTQLASKVWHTLWYRESSRTISYSRLQAVEHEALVTLLAAKHGARVPELAAVGSATSELALVAFRVSGERLDNETSVEPGNDDLVRLWSEVARLHERSVSHGALQLDAVRLDAEGPMITDFALGSLAPDDGDRAADVVELLYSLATVVGEERAVRTALDGLGRDSLVAALPYLQVAGVSPATRRRSDEPKKLISSLSTQIVQLTGAEAPEPVKLRRVSLRNVIMAGLLLLVASALIPLFTSVDYAEIWAVLQNADATLIVLAFIVGHLQFFPSATSTMFAVSATLPFWPLLILQTASQFISLAIPSSAGRIAMNAAFLHNFGVPVASAVAQGAIDGFSGFLVQAAILLIVLLTGDVDLGFDIDTSDVPWLLIILITALVVVGVVVTILRVRALRDRIVPVVKQGWKALLVVLKNPTRAVGLLGSNFVFWNILGLTLWLLLNAVGAELGYGSALFVAAGTSLFAGFMPIPGGVGVAEATMTALLVTFGVDESAAFAVTFVYRLITFYLPALEGFFGSRWLERHDYI